MHRIELEKAAKMQQMNEDAKVSQLRMQLQEVRPASLQSVISLTIGQHSALGRSPCGWCAWMAVARVQAQEDIAEGRVRHERSLSDLSAMKQQLAGGTERCAAYEAELAETRQRTAKLASVEAELATLRDWHQSEKARAAKLHEENKGLSAQVDRLR